MTDTETDSRANSTGLFLDAMAQKLAAGVSKDEASKIIRAIYDRAIEDDDFLLKRAMRRMGL